ncbi:hypothetical protein BJ166DRAFT_629804 [Pestalotiopsis sp. NC0098]|nr:hypothetical protein BJ166DRAFT_629804 [Pestalotiopsis sp. NC0098]
MSDDGSLELSSILQRSSIADEIWGPTRDRETEQARTERLKSFFVCYKDEQDFEQLEHDDIFPTIRILKQSPQLRRSDLYREDSTSSIGDRTAEAALFDLAVRSMFLTACMRRAQPGAEALNRETIFRPCWKESESLIKYLSRVFPISQPPQQDLLAFNADKLRASYLQAYASIQIEWTNYLSDHLVLLRGDTFKKLYIFRHPGFIKVSLERLAADEEESPQTLIDAVKLGCLSPALLKETLLTFDLVFPVVGDRASRTILEKEVRDHGLDPYLLVHFYQDSRDHECPRDAIEPRDIKSLYEKYPYWADRLYDLWREADDPTPITTIERWSEARRNPRFTYWCAVVSIILAFTFGMISTGLAAVQVWIAWCDWIGDPTAAQCGYQRPGAGDR